MRKQISIIFQLLLVAVCLTGCGMPGPLYQETQQSEQPVNTNKPTEESDQEN